MYAFIGYLTCINYMGKMFWLFQVFVMILTIEKYDAAPIMGDLRI